MKQLKEKIKKIFESEHFWYCSGAIVIAMQIALFVSGILVMSINKVIGTISISLSALYVFIEIIMGVSMLEEES